MTYRFRPLQLNSRDFAGLGPDGQMLVDQLAERLNPFLLSVSGGFDGRIGLENLNAVVRRVEFTAPSPWVELPVLNGWSAVTPPGVMRDSYGFVRLRGHLQKAVPRAGNLAMTILPEAFWPPTPGVEHSMPIWVAGTGLVSYRIWIDAAGNIYSDAAPAPGDDYLDGAFFLPKAEAFATLPAPFPISVDVGDLSGPVRGVVVLQCEDLSDRNTAGSDYPQLRWNRVLRNGRQFVDLQYASNLREGHPYRLTLLMTA